MTNVEIELSWFFSFFVMLFGNYSPLMKRIGDLKRQKKYYRWTTNMYMIMKVTSKLSDIDSIRDAISNAAITLCMDTTLAILCGILLFNENKQLFSIALIMVIVYAIIVVFYRKPIEKNSRTAMEHNARVQAWLKESLAGLETVKAANAGEKIKSISANKLDDFIQSMFRYSVVSFSQDTLANTIELMGTVIILWSGFTMAYNGIIGPGSVITFYALLAYFTTPVKNLIQLQPVLQKAFVAADRLNDILSQDIEKDDYVLEIPTIHKWSLQDVNFRYGNRELTLQDVTITVRSGERIAIVGESGSGKTTLAKLFLRFYSPEYGQVLADNKPLAEYSLSSLRDAVAYVPQETFLLTDSIRNNLTLSNPSASDDDIRKVCRICHADEFINGLPLEYDYPLAENGANLSGGQRQRLSIARALLKKPQLLILDEATSHLDTITESGIKNTIFNYDQELACIFITHRLTTIKDCDCIYVMDHGKIVEHGTHEELIKKKGLYLEMWNTQ